MSSALAIAAVTVILRDLLRNRVIDASAAMATDVKVTAIPPNRVKTDTSEVSGLNLFMYRVSPNQGWNNASYPTFTNDGGRRIANQPLPLNLHYLISAYGAEDFHTDVLLGYAMQLLHETPVLTRDVIQTRALATSIGIDTNGNDLPTTLRMLRESDLANQVESIRLTPESLSTEEMARLWAAFQAPYRPTAIYQASVVLIEPDRPVPSPQPVQRRTLAVEQVGRPVITGVTAANGPDQPIVAGSAIVISGSTFNNDAIEVILDNELPTIPSQSGRSFVAINLPVDLAPGFHTVQIVRPRFLGNPPARRGETRSAPFDLAVHPLILDGSITAETHAVPDSEPAIPSTLIALTLNAPVRPDQRVSIELLPVRNVVWTNDLLPVFAGEASIGNDAATRVTAEIREVNAGRYCLRARVDGIDSPITFETNDATGSSTPTGPIVTVPPL